MNKRESVAGGGAPEIRQAIALLTELGGVILSEHRLRKNETRSRRKFSNGGEGAGEEKSKVREQELSEQSPPQDTLRGGQQPDKEE